MYHQKDGRKWGNEMIIQEYGKYTFICDICNGGTDAEFYSFDDAVEGKSEIGWKSEKTNDNWKDICPDCQKEKGGWDKIK